MLLHKMGLIERRFIDQWSDARNGLFIVCLYHKVSSTREEKSYLYFFSSRLYYNLKDFFCFCRLKSWFPLYNVYSMFWGHCWPKENIQSYLRDALLIKKKHWYPKAFCPLVFYPDLYHILKLSKSSFNPLTDYKMLNTADN